MRILVTGADGFTGRYFLDQAKISGAEVYALQSDLMSLDALITEISDLNPTHVVHLAAITSVTHDDEEDFYRVNLFGTLNLLHALTKLPYRLDKILLASSANVYGNVDKAYIDENTEPNPENHYAMSKLAMEHMSKTYLDRLPLFFVRPFNYTGYGQDNRFVIPKIVDHFESRQQEIELGNIAVEREYNDVKTVCSVYIKLLEKALVGEVYNVCSSTSYSLNKILDLMQNIYGYQIKVIVNNRFVRPSEIKKLAGSSIKLEACIGSVSWTPLEELLRSLGSKRQS